MCAHAYFDEADGSYKRPLVTREYNSSWDLYDYHLYPGGAARIHTLRRTLGDEAFWKMHHWVLDHHQDFSLAAALDAAPALGLDRDQLAAMVESEDVRDAIHEDIQFAETMDVKWAPRIFINGRYLANSSPTTELSRAIFERAWPAAAVFAPMRFQRHPPRPGAAHPDDPPDT